MFQDSPSVSSDEEIDFVEVLENNKINFRTQGGSGLTTKLTKKFFDTEN